MRGLRREPSRSLSMAQVPGLMLAGPARAEVKGNGAVLLGDNVVADAHWRRIIRVVTHAHSDHVLQLNRSSKECLLIVATETTHRFLEALGYKIPAGKRLSMNYWSSFEVEEETVTLVPSRHIAGSAQVVVEGRDYRVAYTGDFKMPGTPPIGDLDVLVVDATYGSPRLQRRWSEWDALSALIDIVEAGIRKGPVWIYGYHGKLQEVMVELRVRGIDYPFLADKRTVDLARIASEFYGVRVDPIHVYRGGGIREPVIVFRHSSRSPEERRLPGVHVILTGWELRAPAVEVGPGLYTVSFSDHATFKEVLSYVKESSPKRVIVDAYRGRDAAYTAKYIEKALGIPSTVQPGGGP